MFIYLHFEAGNLSAYLRSTDKTQWKFGEVANDKAMY